MEKEKRAVPWSTEQQAKLEWSEVAWCMSPFANFDSQKQLEEDGSPLSTHLNLASMVYYLITL